MPLIIHRCPFHEHTTVAEVRGTQVTIRAYQIIVWVRIHANGTPSHRFPAILDIGHSLNFSISAEQLRDWAGMDAANLKVIGRATLNRSPILLRDANLAMYTNVKGKRDELDSSDPCELHLPEGIVVHPPGDPRAPRLPLLGLRALVHNRLCTIIDGKRRLVTIRRGWF